MRHDFLYLNIFLVKKKVSILEYIMLKMFKKFNSKIVIIKMIGIKYK